MIFRGGRARTRQQLVFMEGLVTRVGVGEKAMAVVAHKARRRSANFCIL